jgi:A/G-specific adenine glycosylase
MPTGKSIPQPQLVESLLHWFAKNQRSLPWRKEYSPYQTWISEVMLQQTRTKTVLPYYERWMQRFPDIRSVAAAPEDQILKHWEGMGYYTRARNIRKTAKILVERFGGVLPDNYDHIINLPGIGRYTAGAIMSLAFNREYPVVDGNIERVFARLFNMEKPVKAKESQEFVKTMARALIPRGKARDFNQALMELGAVICVPKNPPCEICPVRIFCASRRLGVVDQRPVPGSRKSLVPIEVVLGVLVHRRRVLIQKRPNTGLMGGLWEFPGGKLQNGETPEQALGREFHEELQVAIDPVRKLAVIRHQYTSFRVVLHCYLCRFHEGPQPVTLGAAIAFRWVTAKELNQFPFPAANRKLITMLGDLDLTASEG